MAGDAPNPFLAVRFGGRFVVERALRRGGMGAVYVASDEHDGGAKVALKLVRQGLLEEKEAIARFRRESRLLLELDDPHIVRAIAAGEDDGTAWIAMELVGGITLRELLESRGRWPWQQTIDVIRQIALALSAAHARGVIHRDLKPDNVMINDEGAAAGRSSLVKLLDFGVAKQHKNDDAHATHMTGAGLLIGTPGYVAPEVVIDGVLDDPRSDLYAVGVTWFEMLTGRAPFQAKTPMGLALAHAHEPAPTPSSLLPFSPVPAPVESLVMGLMKKAPADRPSSAADLVRALDVLAAQAEQAQQLTSTPLPSLGPSESTVSEDVRATAVVPVRADLSAGAAPPSTPLRLAPRPQTPLILSAPTAAATAAAPPPATRARAAAGVAVTVCLGLVVATVVGGRWEVRVASAAPPPAAPPAAPVEPVPVAPVSPVAPEAPVAPDAPVSPVAPVAPVLSLPAHPPPQLRAPAFVPAPPQSAPPSEVPAPNRRATLTIAPRPVELGWSVSVDGARALEAPRRVDLVAGAHTLTFTSRKVATPVVRTFTLQPNDHIIFAETLVEP